MTDIQSLAFTTTMMSLCKFTPDQLKQLSLQIDREVVAQLPLLEWSDFPDEKEEDCTTINIKWNYIDDYEDNGIMFRIMFDEEEYNCPYNRYIYSLEMIASIRLNGSKTKLDNLIAWSYGHLYNRDVDIKSWFSQSMAEKIGEISLYD